MELKYEYLLFVHIATGGVALVSGLIAAFLKKGSPLHGQFGKIFALSMATSAAVAVALTTYGLRQGFTWRRVAVLGLACGLASIAKLGGLMALCLGAFG